MVHMIDRVAVVYLFDQIRALLYSRRKTSYESEQESLLWINLDFSIVSVHWCPEEDKGGCLLT